jgi:cation diffusion facilitator CzcD-associated flavoprotein CzcO
VDLSESTAPGCKRIIVDPGYLESLNRPNVSLEWDAIESIVEDGIRLKTGEIVPLDVIIFATGYSLVHLSLHLSTRACQLMNNRNLRNCSYEAVAVRRSTNTLQARAARQHI